MKNTMKQIVAVLLLASILLMMSGCYGSFNLTKKVYKWNGTVGTKWTNELVFLVLTVIPVYSIAVGIDAVVLNSIEFWTGTNPVASTVTTKDGATVAFNAENKAVTVNYANTSVTLTKENDKTVARDSQGQIVAYALTTDDGSMNIVDTNGKILRTYSKDQVESMSVNQ
jgi:Domain of unknown function (DUF3332)